MWLWFTVKKKEARLSVNGNTVTARCLIMSFNRKSKLVLRDLSPFLPENSLFGLTLGVEANPGVHGSGTSLSGASTRSTPNIWKLEFKKTQFLTLFVLKKREFCWKCSVFFVCFVWGGVMWAQSAPYRPGGATATTAPDRKIQIFHHNYPEERKVTKM